MFNLFKDNYMIEATTIVDAVDYILEEEYAAYIN